MKANEIFQSKLNFISLDKRLRLDHLPLPIRSYTAQVVGVALFASMIIILSGLGLYPLEQTIEIPENLSPIHMSLSVPFSLIIIVLIGLGLVAGALFYASYQSGWRLAFSTRLTISVLTLVLPLSFLRYTLLIRGVWNGAGLIQLTTVLLATGCGVAALICAFITVPRATRWAPRFVTGSFFGMALAFLLFKLLWDTLARQNQITSETIVVIHLPITQFINYMTMFVGFLGIILFWQAIVEVKLFSRDIGLKMANLSDRIPRLLIALFAVKIIWLVFGYWGVMQGTAIAPWIGSSQDGPLAWSLAILFAIATGWWLTHRRKPVDIKDFSNAALFLTSGFFLPFITAYLILFFVIISTSLGLALVGSFFSVISSGLADIGLQWSILFTFLLLPIGSVFLRSKRFRYLAQAILLAGLCALPFAIQAQFPNIKTSFDYLTYDVALTVILIGLTVLKWRGKQPSVSSWVITLVLVVSTLVALAESIIPAHLEDFSFTLLLVLPILYQLFFDSAELNLAGTTEGQRVIRTLGSQAGLMLVIVWAVVLQLISPGQASWEEVANKVFLPPILALFLAAMITDHEGIAPSKPGETVL